MQGHEFGWRSLDLGAAVDIVDVDLSTSKGVPYEVLYRLGICGRVCFRSTVEKANWIGRELRENP